ncbi:MAG: alpha/beta hydrolase [Burkholderiales bacterium]
MSAKAKETVLVDGPAGVIEAVVSDPGAERAGVAIIAHPHPLYGGTLDNKVVQTLAKAFESIGYMAVRFNFRGVGDSAGEFDEGRGELKDLLAVAAHVRSRIPGSGLVLAGFSFGASIAAAAAEGLNPEKLVLIAPPVEGFPIGEVAPGTLVVHGEEDDVAPLADVLAWARPQQLPVVVFPGTGHFFHGMLVPLRDLVMRYCRN